MWKPTHVDVTVIKAKDLIVKGKGSNDVYAIIQLSKEKFQTTTREKTANPEWNEECSFEIPGDMSKTIEITLYHRNLLSIDRFLGRIALPIDELLSFQEKPHAQWYALRAKTTKKKAKYRGEILVRTTFVFRSDALGSATVGGAPSSTVNKGSTLTPLGSEFLRKSATNLPLSLAGKKSSFREKKSDEDKRTSTALVNEDGTSRQRLNRSHSLAALTVALRRASFGKKGSSKNKDDDASSETRSNRRRDSDDDDDDQSESVASRTRIETDEERDDFSTTHAHGPEDSAVIQRKQYSLPHTVGSASQALAAPGGISRAVSSVSAGTPAADRFLEREGSGRLNASTKATHQHNSNDSQVSGTGGGIQRQPSARSSASESGLSIDARSQSSGLGFQAPFGNGTPPKSSTLQQISNGTSSHHLSRTSVNSAPTVNTPNAGRFSTTQTPNNQPKGGSFRLPATHHENSGTTFTGNNSSNSGGIAPPSFSPRTSTTVIPSEVYAQYGRMSREELLQVIARQQVEISRRDDYIDEMLSRVMEKAHWILQKS